MDEVPQPELVEGVLAFLAEQGALLMSNRKFCSSTIYIASRALSSVQGD